MVPDASQLPIAVCVNRIRLGGVRRILASVAAPVALGALSALSALRPRCIPGPAGEWLADAEP
jgi:hypothetical protein